MAARSDARASACERRFRTPYGVRTNNRSQGRKANRPPAAGAVCCASSEDRMPDGVRINYCPKGRKLAFSCFLTRPGIQRLAKAMRFAVAPT